MKRSHLHPKLLALSTLAFIAGCGGRLPSSAPTGPEQIFSIGSLTTRVVGIAQQPVSSSSNGTTVSGIAGATVTGLTGVAIPTLENDTLIAYSYFTGSSWDIFTMRPDGREIRNLTFGGTENNGPKFSPDGSKIGFTGLRTGNYEAFWMNADGSNVTNITNNGALDAFLSWSPDSTKALIQSNRDGDFEIYTVLLNGTGLTQLTSNTGIQDENPSFSPDGTQIAFDTDRDGNREIYVMNANGSSPVRLTNSNATEQRPAWSPDGKQISFISDRDGLRQVYAMNSDGTGVRRVIPGSAEEGPAHWSPDGSKILFTLNAPVRVFSVNVDGTGLAQLSGGTPNGQTAFWSPFYPRAPVTLVGTGGILGSAAAGFLVSQREGKVISVLSYDTPTATDRNNARVASLSNDTGLLAFHLTSAAQITSLRVANDLPLNQSTTTNTIALPVNTTSMIVTFSAATGKLVSILPYAANRSVKVTKVGQGLTIIGDFNYVLNSEGKQQKTANGHTVHITPDGIVTITE
jgi:Tol biopolymer transport system component